MIHDPGPTPSVATWYRPAGAVRRWFYAVFEGGGAKGVAYSGALLAMKEKRCWFRGVAGASAGAITAGLVAGGLSPEEIEDATADALEQVGTGVWSGLRRLKDDTGYFPSDKLRDWFERLLRKQLGLAAGSQARVTFEQLYEATGIELSVVAADISTRRQVILSHIETPGCSVADAVVASSSIPFAFRSWLLEVPDGTGGEAYHHTVVDGGVWSNFPMFIYEDPAFRRFYGREPERIDPSDVIGFYLKEAAAPPPLRGEGVRFVEADDTRGIRAVEWLVADESDPANPPRFRAKVGAWALAPLGWLGRFVEWNGGVERGRWPRPRSKLARHLTDSITGLLGGMRPAFLGLLVWILIVVGSVGVIRFVTEDQLNAIRSTDWRDLSSVLIRAFTVLLALSVGAIAVLVVFVAFLGVASNFVLLRAARRLLYGLVTTYVAGPGAPNWVDGKKNVIALPIPRRMRTLSFDMTAEDRRDLVESARRATLEKLDEILSAGASRSRSM